MSRKIKDMMLNKSNSEYIDEIKATLTFNSNFFVHIYWILRVIFHTNTKKQSCAQYQWCIDRKKRDIMLNNSNFENIDEI